MADARKNLCPDILQQNTILADAMVGSTSLNVVWGRLVLSGRDPMAAARQRGLEGTPAILPGRPPWPPGKDPEPMRKPLDVKDSLLRKVRRNLNDDRTMLGSLLMRQFGWPQARPWALVFWTEGVIGRHRG